MDDLRELEPRPGETVPMDYPEHENSYKMFRRLIVLMVVVALIYIAGWMLWL